ncbi:MAG: hypothetical protein H7239_04295 [Flavobacterium sp.]|nr:hypothetical protein [Flavobacterium sp.]
MKRTISILILFFAISAESQSILQIDSLNIQICKSLEKFDSLDELKFQGVLQNHMPDFYTHYKIDTKSKSDSLMDLVYYRLQKNCNTFVVLMSKLEENKSDWGMSDLKPESEISESELKNFFLFKKLHYKEYDGKIAMVNRDSNLWSEKFEDGSSSKLEFKKTSESTFVLKFIESNNEMRKNLSVKGEEFKYGIYGKGQNYYSAWVQSKEGKYYTFKLYLE